MPSDDPSLLLAWKSGSRKAGEALFERDYDVLARFFANKAMEAREDLVQATLMTCLENVDQLREATSFRSFLFAIARYELLHHYHRRRSKRETPPGPGRGLAPRPGALAQPHRRAPPGAAPAARGAAAHPDRPSCWS